MDLKHESEAYICHVIDQFVHPTIGIGSIKANKWMKESIVGASRRMIFSYVTSN